MRLLALQRRMLYNVDARRQGQEFISHAFNIQPPSKLLKVKTALEHFDGESKETLLGVTDYRSCQ